MTSSLLSLHAALAALALAGGAAAQTKSPFVPGTPGTQRPGLAPSSALPAQALGTTAATPALPTAAALGAPRVSVWNGVTRVNLDLPAGANATFTPTSAGLRLDVRGVSAAPTVIENLGANLTTYRVSAAAGSVTIIVGTPYPLGLDDGWRAASTPVTGGGSLLTLEFGGSVRGGAVGIVGAEVRTTPPAAAIPPGDAHSGQVVTPPTLPPLPGASPTSANTTSGRVPGTPQAGAQLTAPRVGKNPGLTRAVLDLPPGVSFRVTPSGTALRVDVTGAGAATMSAQNVSPELGAWRVDPSGSGAVVTFITPTPLAARSGWRSLLLPPVAGSDRSRLALDFSPALADLTPLPAAERTLAFIPPVQNLTLASAGGASDAFAPGAPAVSTPARVVIDAGHGGVDPGAIGTVTEKAVTLDVALRVRDLLRGAGVDVVMTRDRDTQISTNKNADLAARAALASAPANLFVSIHVNSMDRSTMLRGYGVETWWYPNNPNSSTLARNLQNRVVGVTGAYSRGTKNSQPLYVLRYARVPAALVEIGYASHPVDGLNLQSDAYLERVAVGIAQGIRDTLLQGITK
ncbi:N-acetylmuramoyl-L-alanine amidase [Deinococcus maricopensis]|uniref:N-acetylmuramoyl-L-alanine amidase n=1 Tax=Deinococcus maricopensis TaxID=309887 RepID=UPI001FDF3463|nr:N-acetylmuramoyl-L-alanine amidase [Deinococcus maricopensis]